LKFKLTTGNEIVYFENGEFTSGKDTIKEVGGAKMLGNRTLTVRDGAMYFGSEILKPIGARIVLQDGMAIETNGTITSKVNMFDVEKLRSFGNSTETRVVGDFAVSTRAGCKEHGAPCVNAEGCCDSTALCIYGKCRPCVPLGDACFYRRDCCDNHNIECLPYFGKCIKCVAQNQHCEKDGDCCSKSCKGNKCQCTAEGGYCVEGECCGDMTCIAGECLKCKTFGAPCRYEAECCSRYCVGPHGKEVCGCGDEGELCSKSEHCCYKFSVCNPEGKCQQCRTGGETCGGTDPQCCKDYGECVGGKCNCKAKYEKCTKNDDCCDERVGCTGGVCKSCVVPNSSYYSHPSCSVDADCCGYKEDGGGSICSEGDCKECIPAGQQCNVIEKPQCCEPNFFGIHTCVANAGFC